MASFILVNSETKTLTRALAVEFRDMDASQNERLLNAKRVTFLNDMAETGQLVAFNWAVGRLGGRRLRVNGQHSSTMLAALDPFPEGLKVHIDEYEVDDLDGLALLYRQFDPRKSGRTSADIAGAYQAGRTALEDIPRPTGKIGIEAIAWYENNMTPIKGDALRGDDRYQLFMMPSMHSFLIQLNGIYDIKRTPELSVPVIAAMYATFRVDPETSKTFWSQVVDFSTQYDEAAPATVLSQWLKAWLPRNRGPNKKPSQREYFSRCSFAWNAFRNGKPIPRVWYDANKSVVII